MYEVVGIVRSFFSDTPTPASRERGQGRPAKRGVYGYRIEKGMAKNRWEIENKGFNEAKSRHGLEHICHHHANSLQICWLLIILALTIERLYRQRYLRRGLHPQRSGAELFLILWLNLFRPCPADTS
jgi:hypothetical protein